MHNLSEPAYGRRRFEGQEYLAVVAVWREEKGPSVREHPLLAGDSGRENLDLLCCENSLSASNPRRFCASLQQVIRGVLNHRQLLLG